MARLAIWKFASVWRVSDTLNFNKLNATLIWSGSETNLILLSEDMHQTQKAQSYIYYRTLHACYISGDASNFMANSKSHQFFKLTTKKTSNYIWYQVPISLHRVSIIWEELTWSFITTMNQGGFSICYDLTTVQWKLEHHPFSHGGIYTYIWPPFRMQHFHIHFLVCIWLYLDSNFTFSIKPAWVQNRWQAIISSEAKVA